MSRVGDSDSTPKAIIHKRILRAAKTKPEASIEELADDVGGASPDLVERVLDEYGDPGENESSDQIDGPVEHGTASEGVSDPSPEDHPPTMQNDASSVGSNKWHDSLTDIQHETLVVLATNPNATQRELGDKLGVAPATVSRRLSGIPGFEWEAREEFINTFSSEVSSPNTDLPMPQESTNHETEQVENDFVALETKIEALEDEVDDLGSAGFSNIPPDLLHKVIHAIVQSDRISEEEELTIIRSLLGRGSSPSQSD